MLSSDDPQAAPSTEPVRDLVAAYVVLSHRDPRQVERLVAAIRRSSPRSFVLVAHDGRHSPAPQAQDERVHVWEHGLQSDWGSWELVEATLGAFRLARELADPDLVALVSGADYPTRDLELWERGFVAAGGGWVGEAHPLRYRPRWGSRYGEGEDDLTRYVYRWFPVIPTGVGERLPRAVEALRRRARDALFLRVEPALGRRFVSRGRGTHIGVRRLRTPFSDARPCFKGSQWVAMDRRMLDRLLEEAGPGSPLARYYRHSIIPDESLIPTLLSWTRPSMAAPPLTFVEWVTELDEPRTLTHTDLRLVEQSGAPFCRKVRSPDSDSLMAALDERRAQFRRDDRQRS